MPTVSTDIDAFLNAADNAAARTALGAGTPPTTESVLALVADQNIEANGWTLANTAGVALASGVIGWNNTLSTFVRHDGSTLGGVPILLSDPSVKRGSVAVANYTAAKETELAAWPLTALQAVVGKRFRITGSIEVIAIGSNKPPNFYLGFTTRSNIDDDLGGLGAFPARLGYLVGFTYSTTSKDTWIFNLNEELILNDATPNFVLSFYDAYRRAQIFNETTITGDAKSSGDTISIETDLGLVGTANEEIVLVLQGEAGGGSVGSLKISYNLKFEQTA
jgi:hypothetical protein